MRPKSVVIQRHKHDGYLVPGSDRAPSPGCYLQRGDDVHGHVRYAALAASRTTEGVPSANIEQSSNFLAFPARTPINDA